MRHLIVVILIDRSPPRQDLTQNLLLPISCLLSWLAFLYPIASGLKHTSLKAH